MTSNEQKKPERELSPTSRRAFLMAVPATVAASAAATALGGCGGGGGGYGNYGDYSDLCYCNGSGRDYNEVCGAYCNYLNYSD